MMKSQTPRTDKFFRDRVRLMLDPEDFTNRAAQARVVAQIEEMMFSCRLFSRQLEREANEGLRKP